MRPTTLKARDLQPVQTLARAAGKCSNEARMYAACVAANYENVEKAMCQEHFNAFKACVQDKLKRKW